MDPATADSDSEATACHRLDRIDTGAVSLGLLPLFPDDQPFI